MLWYKVWQETRTRFFISGMALTTFCLVAVLFEKQFRAMGGFSGERTAAYTGYIYHSIYGPGKAIFVLLALPFLGLGGLLREKLRGTTGFTLALPLTRLRLVWAYVGLGMAETAILSMIPLLTLIVLSPLVHESYPFTEAFHFSILWFICGGLIFSVAFFLSTVMSGEYTAPVACIILLYIQALVAAWHPLVPYRVNILWTINAYPNMSWNPDHTLLLSGPLPWTRLVTILLVSFGLLGMATLITRRQDF
jgi:ABC-type transport system involved in multi-copper enzyme maturation permease subunit